MITPTEAYTSPSAVPHQDPAELLAARLRKEDAPRITGERVIPVKQGDFRPLPGDLDPRLAESLRGRGITLQTNDLAQA